MNEKICNGNHKHPVHFNTGSRRHIWICLNCRRQLRGSPLADDEREIMIEFAKYFSEEIQSRKALTTAPLVRKEETMNQVTVTVSGASRVELVKNLRAFADNLDGSPAQAKTGKVVAQEDVEETADADDEEFAPKKKPAKKVAASFDDEAEEEVEETEDEEVEEEAPKAKKAKAPTKDDVNEACKLHAKRHSFDDTKALLMKKFKTSSVSKLKPEQYPAVIAAMKG